MKTKQTKYSEGVMYALNMITHKNKIMGVNNFF